GFQALEGLTAKDKVKTSVTTLSRRSTNSLIDSLYREHGMDLPASLGAGRALIHHPPLDLARLAVGGIEKGEPCYADLHRGIENAFVADAAVVLDNIEYLFPLGVRGQSPLPIGLPLSDSPGMMPLALCSGDFATCIVARSDNQSPRWEKNEAVEPSFGVSN